MYKLILLCSSGSSSSWCRNRELYLRMPFLRYRKFPPPLQTLHAGWPPGAALAHRLGRLAHVGFEIFWMWFSMLTRIFRFLISLKRWKNLAMMVPSIRQGKNQPKRRLDGTPGFGILSLVAILIWVCL